MRVIITDETLFDHDIIYRVDEEKGIVVAKYEEKNAMFYIVNESLDKFDDMYGSGPFLSFALKGNLTPLYKFIKAFGDCGIARCAMDEDKFDLEYGKHLAKIRLKNLTISILAQFQDEFRKEVHRLMTAIDKYNNMPSSRRNRGMRRKAAKALKKKAEEI